jgi:uncharacterized protein
MKFLADVNVIFPLLVSRHQQRAKSLEWFDEVSRGEVVLCRLTRLGTLRLLCTAKVMGPDVLSPSAAIAALEILEADERMVFKPEPDGLDEVLKTFVSACTPTPNLWTDAYLASFAAVAGLRLVSFDGGFVKFPRLDWRQLVTNLAE